MKGLYVYGALLMAMCFTIGVLHSPWVMGIALISCALAALSEAVHEANRGISTTGLHVIGNGIALASWVSTAIAAIVSLLVIVGAL